MCVILQPILAYFLVCYAYMKHTGRPFWLNAPMYYYSLAFTCAASAMLFAELVLILGSLGLFRLALTLTPNGMFFSFGNIFLALAFAAPIFMVFTGIIPYCWGK
jgi:hypothetical protein